MDTFTRLEVSSVPGKVQISQRPNFAGVQIRTVWLNSLHRRLIDSVALSLAYRNDRYHHFFIPHLVHQPKASASELDFVAIPQAAQSSAFHPWEFQSLCQLLLKLRSNRRVQFVPLLLGFGFEQQPIGHLMQPRSLPDRGVP